VTVSVMFVIAVVGLIAYVIAKPWRAIGQHLHDDLEPTGAERG
jgi:hypothetical protein